MFDELGTDRGYNGNPLLKKVRKQLPWSQEQFEEYVKCAEDPVYFSERYIKIVHVDHGFIPIQLYDYQKEIIQKVNDNRRTIVVTSRQAGKCVSINTPIKLRNKTTGEVVEITMGEFYEMQRKKHLQNEDE